MSTEKKEYSGPAGPIEAVLDTPRSLLLDETRGLAVIAHPHPLHGGTMTNKVVHTLARAAVACGWSALRFNFRGIGASAGEYDAGRGELQDMLAVIEQACGEHTPLIVAGFSFGAFVASNAVAQLHAAGRQMERIILVGTAAENFDVAPIPAELHEKTLVVHGEADETVALSAVMDWARPQDLPVLVVPGGEHFFHGRLPLLKMLAERHIGHEA